MKQQRRTVMVALAATVLCAGSAWAAYPLKAIDFVSTDQTTEVLLHTGSIVPVKTVLATNNKIVLDIDQVLPDETVQTMFRGNRHISHVVMQPISDHTMRLIIRGEGMGELSVGFKDSSVADTPTTGAEGESLWSNPKMADHGIKSDIPLNQLPDTEEIHSATKPLDAQAIHSATAPVSSASSVAADPSAEPSLDQPIVVQQPAVHEAVASLPPPIAPSQPKAASEHKTAVPNSPAISPVKAQSAKAHSDTLDIDLSQARKLADQLLPWSIAGLLFLGLGIFLKLKWQSIRKSMGGEPKTRSGRTVANNGRSLPVGLGSLRESLSQSSESLPRRQAVETHRRVSSSDIGPEDRMPLNNPLLQSPAIPKAAPRQAVQQYQQAAGKRPTPGNASKGGNLPPSARAAASKKSGTPLPANPEVLDFLKNVADLMEKDGNKMASKSIKRTMNPIR